MQLSKLLDQIRSKGIAYIILDKRNCSFSTNMSSYPQLNQAFSISRIWIVFNV
jgi:hypothetical protein